MITLPSDFAVSKLSPPKSEQLELENLLTKYCLGAKSVAEFGCGPSTFVINSVIKPTSYVAVEDAKFAQPQIQSVQKHCPNVQLVQNWDFTDLPYDLVFIDSSACNPLNSDGAHRDLAAQSVTINAGGHIILHDCHRGSGKKAYAWLCANYKLVDQSKQVAIFTPLPEKTMVFPKADQLTIVQSADSSHLEKILMVLPHNRPLLPFKHIVFAKDATPEQKKRLNDFDVEVIDWKWEPAEHIREEMLSAFIFGVAKHVSTPYHLKIDSCTVRMSCNPWLPADWMNYDMLAPGWRYTKPATAVCRADSWIDGLVKLGLVKWGEGKELKKPWRYKTSGNRCFEDRICSWVKVMKTQTAKDIASNCFFDRLPVPSEDTTCWIWCDRLGKPYYRWPCKAHFNHNKKEYMKLIEIAKGNVVSGE